MSKRIQQTLAALTALSLIMLPPMAEAAPSPKPKTIQIILDGVKQHYDAPPYIKNSRTLVPLRGIFEKFGATVYWDPNTQTALAVKGTTVINLPIGAQTANINGQEVPLDQVAEIFNNRTMVPLRFVSEALGAEVLWDDDAYTVEINSREEYEPSPTREEAGILNLPLQEEISTLDSSKAGDKTSFTVLNQINEGLVRLNERGQAVPGVAKSWSVSPDGRTYTFNLRPDATWSDGSQVTAADFEYAWKRTLDPKTEAGFSFPLQWIEGAEAYSADRSLADEVKVKAKNDTTLEVTLRSPIPFFVEQTALPVFFPQKQSFVSAAGDSFGQEASLTLSNGPFKVSSWAHEQYATLTKNEQYWDHDNVQLNQVNYLLPLASGNPDKMYKSRTLDRMLITPSNFSNYRHSAELVYRDEWSTSFLLFESSRPALKNAKIRKALTSAIDIEHLQTIIGTHSAEATGFVPTGISNGQGGDFRMANGALINRAVSKEQLESLLAEGLKEAGLSQFPSLTVLLDNTATGKRIGPILQREWKSKLSIVVDVKYTDTETKIQRILDHNYDITLTDWSADYNDPMAFLDMFLKENSIAVASGYSNQGYDTLIHKAEQEKDATLRQKYLSDAEKLLLADMPIAPVVFGRTPYVQKYYVKGWLSIPGFAPEYDLKNVYLQGD